MEIPSAPLKAVFFLHFILSVWASQNNDPDFPYSYIYYNACFLLMLVWGIHSRDSEEPIFMGFVINAISILLDIISIVVFFPKVATASNNFCLGMAILNLILRPITCVILHRIRNERAGSYNNFGIPGLGDYFARRGPYENIDQPVAPQSVPQSDNGSPHHMTFGQDKTTLP